MIVLFKITNNNMKKFNLKFSLLALFLTTSMVVLGQKNYNWHFGHNAGLYFSGGGSPVATTGNDFSTEMGSASISDDKGNVLMYTDGRVIYDKNNKAMPNGTGLMGNKMSSQSAIFIPVYGKSNLYLLFYYGRTQQWKR